MGFGKYIHIMTHIWIDQIGAIMVSNNFPNTNVVIR
jgi:hypothetical protein